MSNGSSEMKKPTPDSTRAMINDRTANLAEGGLSITITNYSEHSLKLVATQPLRPGEYALSSRAAFLNLFCFGVDE